ncbi:hypothetical protein Droror1_Dr00009783 [Drosera rotundifolia]
MTINKGAAQTQPHSSFSPSRSFQIFLCLLIELSNLVHMKNSRNLSKHPFNHSPPLTPSKECSPFPVASTRHGRGILFTFLHRESRCRLNPTFSTQIIPASTSSVSFESEATNLEEKCVR